LTVARITKIEGATRPMTPAETETFITLWQAGASSRDIAQAMPCALGTVASRSAALAAQGKIQPRRRPTARPGRKPQHPAPEPPAPVVLSPQARKAAMVAQLRQLRGQGLSLQAIATQLNAEDVPTLSGRGRWTAGAIGNLLAEGEA
jgi:hypothetical protein